jgi:hypothetical protein
MTMQCMAGSRSGDPLKHNHDWALHMHDQQVPASNLWSQNFKTAKLHLILHYWQEVRTSQSLYALKGKFARASSKQ